MNDLQRVHRDGLIAAASPWIKLGCMRGVWVVAVAQERHCTMGEQGTRQWYIVEQGQRRADVGLDPLLQFPSQLLFLSRGKKHAPVLLISSHQGLKKV